MRSTFNVLFFIKKTAKKKDGTSPIVTRITVDGKSCQFNTKQYIKEDKWSVELNRAKGWDAEAKRINNILEEIKTSLRNTYSKLSKKDTSITAEKIKNEFLGINTDKYLLLELFNDCNKTLEKQVGISKSKATLQKAKICRRHLSAFIESEIKQSDIDLRDVNHSFIVGFDTYLRTQGGCNANTTAKFMQKLRSIIIVAINDGKIIQNPFANYKISIKKVDRGYLTDDELLQIIKYEFSTERLERIRDVFIFSCYTGLAYIDIKNLRKENINKGFDGKLWITTKRQKTDVQATIPLLEVAQLILNKYSDTPGDSVLPIPSNQKTNAYLKEIADVCGINKNLTFHLARHTFATTITLSKGVPIESVSKMLGHTDIKTTQIYARITNEKVSRDMETLAEKLAKSGGNPFVV